MTGEQPRRRWAWPVTWLLLSACIALCILFGRAFIHFWGIDTQQSDNYDFFSGPGPVWVSALGLSTIITGLWHGVNCHAAGCWRIGRHKVAGSPWCNRHHDRAREDPDPVSERLDRIIELLERRDSPS